MKPSIIIFSILLVFAALYAFRDALAGTRVERNGFSFSHPRALQPTEIPSTEGNYANYQFTTNGTAENPSTITVALPLTPTSQAYAITDAVTSATGTPMIETITLRQHAGIRASYEKKTAVSSDVRWRGSVIREEYPSGISNSPVVIEFNQGDDASEVRSTWEMIRRTLRW